MTRSELITEREWQAQVCQLAAANGWRILHVRKTIGRRNGARAWTTSTNIPGWPDLWLWHERDRRFCALELKVGRNRATEDQVAVLRSLHDAGADVMVAYPRDLDRLTVLLARRRDPARR